MKFTIPKKDLARAVGLVIGSAAKSSPQPALSCVRIVAGERVAFTASDLMVGATSDAAAKVSEPGSVLVPAKALGDAVKGLLDGDVAVTVDGPRVQFKCGKSVQRIAWSNADDYPALPQMDPSKAVTVPAPVLSGIVGEVAHAMPTDETRPTIAGVFVDIDGKRARAVALSGAVFAKRDVQCDAGPISFLLPMKRVSEVKRVFDGVKESTVDLAVHDMHLFVRTDAMTMSVRLTGETFLPQWPNLIPKSTTHRAVVSREAFADSVRRVSGAVDEQTAAVVVTLSDGSISLRAVSKDADASDAIDVDYSGDGLTIGAKASTLIAMLAASTSDDVAVEFCGPLDPIVIVATGNTDAVHLMMPSKTA